MPQRRGKISAIFLRGRKVDAAVGTKQVAEKFLPYHNRRNGICKKRRGRQTPAFFAGKFYKKHSKILCFLNCNQNYKRLE